VRESLQYLQRVSRISDIAREYWFEGAVALLAIVGLLDLAVRRDAPNAPQSSLWFAVAAVAVLVLALCARRRFPFAGPTAYWLLAAGISFVDWSLIPFMSSLVVVGMAAAFLLGNLRDRLQAAIGLTVVLGAAATIVYKVPGHPTSLIIFLPLEFGISWLAGYALRERAEQAEAAEVRAVQAEREREAAARVAVAEERARIARELHDIVAHSVSIMVLQVGAIRHKLPEMRAEDRDALRGVEQTGRGALAEMRRLLGAMRRDGDGLELAPHPGVDRLDSLLEDVGRAGLPVRLHVDGNPFPLPRAIDLSAYRIVQEGLTNALKHAHASRVDVTFHYASDELQIEVRDNGEGLSMSDGLGRGLVGIRERVKIYGGEMTAGAAPEGGFVLGARLPLEGYQT
jgi:signal transduction histidine kinase